MITTVADTTEMKYLTTDATTLDEIMSYIRDNKSVPRELKNRAWDMLAEPGNHLFFANTSGAHGKYDALIKTTQELANSEEQYGLIAEPCGLSVWSGIISEKDFRIQQEYFQSSFRSHAGGPLSWNANSVAIIEETYTASGTIEENMIVDQFFTAKRVSECKDKSSPTHRLIEYFLHYMKTR